MEQIDILQYFDSNEMIKQQQWRDWSALPNGILFDLINKLTMIDDYVRFGAVCISWRNVFLAEVSQFKYKQCIPFLLISPPPKEIEEVCNSNNINPKKRKHVRDFSLIPHRREQGKSKRRKMCSSEEGRSRSLYNTITRNVYNFQVRVPHDRICRGSSFGWLVTIKKRSHGDIKYYVQLQNPFLPDTDIIHLPQVSIDGIFERGCYDEPSNVLNKAILSAAPDNNINKNFVVMAVMTGDHKLAYFNPADKEFCWNLIGDWDDRSVAFGDLIYFRSTQQFYALDRVSGAVFGVAIKDRGSESYTFPELTKVTPAAPNLIDEMGHSGKYIVESPEGDLLLVLKGEWRTAECETRFQVLKFDPVGKKWNKISHLGDTILFLGNNSSISRSASDFPECKPNCIYYTYNDWGDDMGIFDLEDGTVKPHYPMPLKRSGSASPIWIEPTLQVRRS
ncbi:hypothetical protein ACHQM5_023515 [Ranunculus cassubicifolius]